MNNKDVSTHMNYFKSLRRDDGMTMVSTFAGLVIAGVVLTALTLFWINSNQSAKNVTDTSAQESAGLRVLNAAAKDIGAADPVVFAEANSVVVDHKKSSGKTRIRYRIDASNASNPKIVREVNENPPAGDYNPNTSFPASGSGVKTKVMAERAKTGEAMFKYFDNKGKPWTSASSPEAIARVDINFKADAGKGYVELKTKASVRKALGDSGENTTGAGCFIDPSGDLNSSNDPVISWAGSPTAVDTYRIIRNGTQIGSVPANGPLAHSYTDTTASYGANVYVIQPVTGSVVTTTCTPVVVNKAIDPPSVGGDLIGDDTVMRLQWTNVTGATGYEITYQQVNALTDALIGSPQSFTVTGDSGTSADGKWLWHTSDNTTYAEFDAPLGTQYRFSVKSVAPSGKSLPSNEFDLMNKPSAPGAPSASAQTYSVNRVTLDKKDNEGFRIRSFRGATESAAATAGSALANYTDTKNGNADVKMAVDVTPGTQTSDTGIWDHRMVGGTQNSANPNQDFLGYWYSYEIRKTNHGPRVALPGQTRAQQTETVVSGDAGTSRTAATALQYPQDPVIKVSGTERAGIESNNGDADGENQILVERDLNRAQPNNYHLVKHYKSNLSWADRIDQVSYPAMTAPARWRAVDGCEGGAKNLCIYDQNSADADKGKVEPGTRFFYRMWAENATGNSPSLSVVNADTTGVAYQRPNAVKLHRNLHAFWARSEVIDPSLTTTEDAPGKPRGNKFTIAFHLLDNPGGYPIASPDYPQANQHGSYKFCGDPAADCRYIVKRRNADNTAAGFVQRKVLKPGDAEYTNRVFEDYATDWGTRDDYVVQACNAGGCASDSNVEEIFTYPGPFTPAEDMAGIEEYASENYAVGYAGPSTEGRLNGSLVWGSGATGSIQDRPKATGLVGKPVNWRFARAPFVENCFDDGAKFCLEDDWFEIGPTAKPPAIRANPSTLYQWRVTAKNRYKGDVTRRIDYVKRTPPPRLVYTANVSLCHWTAAKKYNSGTFGSKIEIGDRTHSPTMDLHWSGASTQLEVRVAYANSNGADEWTHAYNRLTSSNPDGIYRWNYGKGGNDWAFTPTGGNAATAAGKLSQATQKVNYIMWQAQRILRTNRTVRPHEYVAWYARNTLTTNPTGFSGTVKHVREYGDTNIHIDYRTGNSNGAEGNCVHPDFAYVYETGSTVGSGAKYTEKVKFNSNFEYTLAPGFQAKMNTESIPSSLNKARVSTSSASYLPPAVVPESVRGKPYKKSSYGTLSYDMPNWYVNG